MLIKALCDYYETLAAQGKIIPEGFSEIGVSYMIALNENGIIDSIIDIRDEDMTGKKIRLVPRKMQIIRREGVSAIHSELIEHRGLYIFGLNFDNKTKTFTTIDAKDAARKKHECFVETNLKFIEDIDSPVVNAFRCFLKNWIPQDETENENLIGLGKEIDSANFCFCLSGHPNILLHEDEAVLSKWKVKVADNDNTKGKNLSQCAVLGENLEIAELHNKIKGVRGGQSSGTVFVCFNNDSENSYGMTKSYNSNISQLAMEHYSETLNYLLESKNNHNFINDTTVVYWAEDGNSKADKLIDLLVFDSDLEECLDNEILNSLVNDCREGSVSYEKLKNVSDMAMDTDYYFFGIKPNASRLSVKFVYHKQLAEFIVNVAQHQSDIKICDSEKSVPLWRIKKELVSPKASDETVSPSLIAKLFDSILNGNNYPEELLQKTVYRVKTDVELKINPIRAGIVKACINRKNRINSKEEELNMSLDKNNCNQAYLCGRLFAILEQIQQKASNYSLNRTIKDSYFSAAAARPASVFPKIIKLSQYHLNKLGNPRYFRDDISEITEKLNNEFPSMLSLTEQGKFIIGYYHQINYKNTNNTEDK